MKSMLSTIALFCCTFSGWAESKLPKPLVTGLKNPESVVIGIDGRTYISVIGDFNKDKDGAILVLKNNKAVPFVTGLNDPKGLVRFQKFLYVADKDRIWRIDPNGKAGVFVAPEKFPQKPLFLNDMAVDHKGNLFVSDSGDLKGSGGKVFRIDPRGRASLVVDGKTSDAIKAPNGLCADEHQHLLMVDFGSGALQRINLAKKTLTKVADGFGGADGLLYDKYGQLFITDWTNGKVYGIPRPGVKPVLVAEGFQAAADICLDAKYENLLVPDMKAGTLTAIPTTIPGWEVDQRPLDLEAVTAYPRLKWTKWSPELPSGKLAALRPIVLTHAGDGSNRVFVATQRGVIHVFENDQKATKTKIFMDIQDRVIYNDRQNEEGFLGLAFHPKFKSNGEFFIYYSTKKARHTSVVSRFRVSRDNPDQADPTSEEEILRIKQPFWNHNGGTIAFGPDGKLYIALGDGGAANDPLRNGQNLKTLLGSVLRIDIDSKDEGKNYAIPKDNPFVGKKDARPEIWAYGIRNIWRLAFDQKTGDCWAGEVGQNLWEEINLMVSGGNYGWNPRESMHPFGANGIEANKKMIEPIWEYHHDVGKSITGGVVYRGRELPELNGMYLYADYVTGHLWALKYDKTKKRVVANRRIRYKGLPVLSFGEDEKGEVYFMVASLTGQGLFRIERAKAGTR